MATCGESIETELLVPSHPPPPQQRRPRVREVSSRFMTPSSSRSSSSSLLSPRLEQKQRSSSVQKQRSSGHSFYADENKNEMNRSSPQPKSTLPRAAVKLTFREGVTRIDTPIVNAAESGFRIRPSSSSSTAAKLLQFSGLSPSVSPTSSLDCEDRRSGSNRSFQDVPSPMLDGETIRNGNRNSTSNTPMGKATPGVVVSSRYLTERNSRRSSNSAGGIPDSPCARSLEFPQGSSALHSVKGSDRDQRDRKLNLIKLSSSGLTLPPHPTLVKQVINTSCNDATGKPKKSSGQQEDAHNLKLFHNRYLQWRFANAKAEASLLSQQQEAEKTLYSHSIKLAGMYESVTRKRVQLTQLRNLKILSDILDMQMPCLDEWSALEEEYALSLSDTIQGLMNASLRVPLIGSVTADAVQLKEALNSATRFLESICLQISSFMFNAEQTAALMAEVAKVTARERMFIEESGGLVSTTYKSHVEECSLRSQIIQQFSGSQKN